jgi:hypothetical protein
VVCRTDRLRRQMQPNWIRSLSSFGGTRDFLGPAVGKLRSSAMPCARGRANAACATSSFRCAGVVRCGCPSGGATRWGATAPILRRKIGHRTRASTSLVFVATESSKALKPMRAPPAPPGFGVWGEKRPAPKASTGSMICAARDASCSGNLISFSEPRWRACGLRSV